MTFTILACWPRWRYAGSSPPHAKLTIGNMIGATMAS